MPLQDQAQLLDRCAEACVEQCFFGNIGHKADGSEQARQLTIASEPLRGRGVPRRDRLAVSRWPAQR